MVLVPWVEVKTIVEASIFKVAVVQSSFGSEVEGTYIGSSKKRGAEVDLLNTGVEPAVVESSSVVFQISGSRAGRLTSSGLS